MTKNYVFPKGGATTEPEVNALLDKFGTPAPNQQIKYAEIEEVIGIKWDQRRWKTITQVWRKKLEKNHNVILKPVFRGEAFQCLNDSGRINLGVTYLNGGLDKIVRGSEVVIKTPRQSLTDEEKRLADHILKCAANFRLAAIISEKSEIKLPELDRAIA
jgi:hypothetical protein